MQNINVNCILGFGRKMSEIIQLIRYENNVRLGSDCLSDQNDHWNSNLSKNRPTCVFIVSFSINDVATFGCVIDKQYDHLSDLISFSTAKNQITFYRLYNFLPIDLLKRNFLPSKQGCFYISSIFVSFIHSIN